MRELSSSDIGKVGGGASGGIDPLTSVLMLVTSPITAALVAWSSAGQLDYGQALAALWRSALSGGKH